RFPTPSFVSLGNDGYKELLYFTVEEMNQPFKSEITNSLLRQSRNDGSKEILHFTIEEISQPFKSEITNSLLRQSKE
ncbi:hypothetical protein, partial [Vibrio sp. 10N.261.52.A1]|uniref:hypothetical protein n=1 Tax=Vibrio sp. 10N.261.52.A1 TaxID=1880849 RepID=UPI001A7E0AEC